jgi:hypothetical protein
MARKKLTPFFNPSQIFLPWPILSAATTSTHNTYAAARAIPPFLCAAPAHHCLPYLIVLPSTTSQHTRLLVVTGHLIWTYSG